MNNLKKLKKIFCLVMISIVTLSITLPKETKASFSINKASLYSKGKCQTLLKVRENGGDIFVYKVFYNHNGKEYPAYCLNVEKSGVGTVEPYDLTIDDAVQNQLVWRTIINGYPYQSLESLGVTNEDEAYTATKQAVYCVLYNNDANDFYKYLPVGEAGQRTLNAMKQIVSKARNNTNIKPSNIIKINQKTGWSQYKTEYIESTFEITTECNFKDCKLKLVGNNIAGIKIVNNNYNEISSLEEKQFKILVPVEKLNENGLFEIEVEGNLATMPILYGKASNSNYQDYALAGEIYEGGNGRLKVEYEKNKSKIIIVKQDGESKERIAGVKFRIVDKDSKILYDNLVTNEEGTIEINGILPGTFYLEEVEGNSNYKKLDEKIEFEIGLDEELTVNVDNKKIDKKEKKTIQRTILPKTGM